MPGRTNTAGFGGCRPRALRDGAARTPVDDVPAHDSGPIGRKPGGASCEQRVDDRLGGALVA